MDTKSKNNRKFRAILTVCVLMVLAVGTTAGVFFAGQYYIRTEQVNESISEEERTESASYPSASYPDENAIKKMAQDLYRGIWVLYFEAENPEETKKPSDIFFSASKKAENVKEMKTEDTVAEFAEATGVSSDVMMSEANRTAGIVDDVFALWKAEYEEYGSLYDYQYSYHIDGDEYSGSNTSALLDSKDMDRSGYQGIVVLSFDKNGVFSVDIRYSNGGMDTDMLLKQFDRENRTDTLRENVIRMYADDSVNTEGCTFYRPMDFAVYFGIPDNMALAERLGMDYDMESDAYAGGVREHYLRGFVINISLCGYLAAFFLLILFAFAMTGKEMREGQTEAKRHVFFAWLEVALCGFFIIALILDYRVGLRMADALINGMNGYSVVEDLCAATLFHLIFYTMWYLCVRIVRPVFSLGITEYFKQYSLCYCIIKTFVRWGKSLKYEVSHIDFSEKTIRTGLKLAGVNFLIVSACSCFWFLGIFPALIYSVVLFLLLKRYYQRTKADYDKLLEGMERMSAGDLSADISEDMGNFNVLRDKLLLLRGGMKQAVENEVKSERMKTELITNVSHDLKTPLTAITTYLELLKKEGITEEEQKSYIEILDRKATRLKVLIEDLFEVSRAASHDITLEPVDVDVVKLLKQVEVEHEEKWAKKGLNVRHYYPEEHVRLMLDSTKTYRIFENLFVNIEKYAMEKSRVYLSVEREAQSAEITLKNISAEEIKGNPMELTERFVRGDVSRNTEGSGLGLAIAKSFTEVQGGSFAVEVDGDLFKVVIRFGIPREPVVSS